MQTKLSTFYLYWAPEGKLIAIVDAKDAAGARRKAPSPYRKFKGEIGVKRCTRTKIARMYQIAYFEDNEILVTSIPNGARVDTWSHGAWHDTGRLPDDIRTIAEDRS
jgi:hypothetical protein